jgi:TRAP-type mannitol/chloroaromatic compound transport system permease small subunit
MAYSLGYFGTEPFTYFGDLFSVAFSEGLDVASAKLGYMERSSTAWRPYLWPIKLLLCFGVFLMLLQVLAEFCRDLARLRGAQV